MADCTRIPSKKKIVCAGDLKHLIEIKTRDIQPPDSGVDFDYQEVTFAKPWAKIETVNGLEDFDNINTGQNITHRFYIRFLDGLTEQEWIIYNGRRYDILNVVNINEENTFMKIECTNKGKDSQPGAQFES
jgi:SPP1 family predicted phage head-tail adaptor